MPTATNSGSGRTYFDFTTVQVEAKVPIPESRFMRQRETGLSAILRNMKIGESIVLPVKQRGSAVSAAKNNDIEIVTRTLAENPDNIRVWKTGVKDEGTTPAAAPATAPKGKGRTPMPVPKLTVAKK